MFYFLIIRNKDLFHFDGKMKDYAPPIMEGHLKLVCKQWWPENTGRGGRLLDSSFDFE